MLQKTEAIVLNRIKYGDSSYIINLYSREFGKFSTLVRILSGKRKGDHMNPNLFTPLNILETEVELKNTRNIQIIKYCNRINVLKNINNDIFKISIAQFIAEIISKTVREEEPNNTLYDFIEETILLLENAQGMISNIHVLFLKEFSKVIGFGITNNYCRETPYFNFREGMFLPLFTYKEEALNLDDSKILSDILDINYPDVNNIRLTYIGRKKLLEIFLKYYEIHILRLNDLKSFKVLNEVFS